jgi:hypothetical protein
MEKMTQLRKHLLYLMIVSLSVISFFTIEFADSKGKVFHVGEVVQGDTYGIKVINAKVTNKFKDTQ